MSYQYNKQKNYDSKNNRQDFHDENEFDYRSNQRKFKGRLNKNLYCQIMSTGVTKKEIETIKSIKTTMSTEFIKNTKKQNTSLHATKTQIKRLRKQKNIIIKMRNMISTAKTIESTHLLQDRDQSQENGMKKVINQGKTLENQFQTPGPYQDRDRDPGLCIQEEVRVTQISI
jgi:hypothetical protein